MHIKHIFDVLSWFGEQLPTLPDAAYWWFRNVLLPVGQYTLGLLMGMWTYYMLRGRVRGA